MFRFIYMKMRGKCARFCWRRFTTKRPTVLLVSSAAHEAVDRRPLFSALKRLAKAMPRDLTHAVLEGLDEAKSTGGLVIMKKKKKEDGEEEKGGFKLPVGPSKLGLDRCTFTTDDTLGIT